MSTESPALDYAAKTEPIDELERLYRHTSSDFQAALDEFTKVIIKRFFGPTDIAEMRAVTTALAEAFANARVFADVLGRLRIIRELGGKASDEPPGPPQVFADGPASGDLPPIMGVPFLEALQNLIDRSPVLALTAEDVRRAYETTTQFALVRSAEQVITEKVQGLVAEQLAQGRDFADFEQAFEELNRRGFNKQYAAVVFRTNLTTAYAAGRLKQAEDMRDEVAGLEFMAVGDDDTRPNHEAADGLIADVADPIWNLLSPPLGYNCYLPGTYVSCQVEGSSKAFYSGEVAEVEIEGGISLTVTVNHPIVTDKGIIPAGRIEEGVNCLAHLDVVESLVSGLRDGTLASVLVPGSRVHDEYAPVLVEDVFEAFRVHGAGAILPRVEPLDFHGEASSFVGEVHVVGSYGEFAQRRLSRVLPTWPEPEIIDKMLSGAASLPLHRSCVRDPFRKAPLSSSVGIPGSGALSVDECGVLLDGMPLQLLRLGPAARLYTMLDESAANCRSAAIKFISKTLFGSSGKVELRKVLSVKISPYSGHVYDLQSPFGHVVADGIVTGNCRCTLRVVPRDEAEGKGLLDDTGRIPRQQIPAGAFPDQPGFGHRPDRAIYGR